MNENPTDRGNCELKSYLTCFLLASAYVSSLYVWGRGENRKHPTTIKKRFISVTIVTLLGPVYVNYFIDQSLLNEYSLWKILGIRWEGLINAIIFPMILTIILFMGPISLLYFNGVSPFYTEFLCWVKGMKDLIWVRNHVMAPISEEFTFRSCMLALIMHCMEPKKAIFICPLFFGTAHLHHIMEQIREGVPMKHVLIGAVFQFGYTSIFGAYSAYLFLRTGHIIAPILVHSFCNHMGVPDFGAVIELPIKERVISAFCFIGGVVFWSNLARTMTDPMLYDNDLPWADRIHYNPIPT